MAFSLSKNLKQIVNTIPCKSDTVPMRHDGLTSTYLQFTLKSFYSFGAGRRAAGRNPNKTRAERQRRPHRSRQVTSNIVEH